MDESAFLDIARYLDSLAVHLRTESHQASILDNASVVGSDREEIYRHFLERHLPIHCDVFRGGYVFNLEGETSKQMDIIVTSGLAPRFAMNSGKQPISPIEGTIATAEIKSYLNKRELENTLDSLTDIPAINEKILP